MTCSAGIAAWEPGDTLPMLLARADAALYDSKRAGRNRTSLRSGNRAAEAMQLRQGIADDELRAFYQPVVDLRTGVVTGVEALVRWLRTMPTGEQLVLPNDRRRRYAHTRPGDRHARPRAARRRRRFSAGRRNWRRPAFQ